MLKNFILNLSVVKKKIEIIETAHRNELNRMATKFNSEQYKLSGQYNLSDKEKIDRINRLEALNKELDLLSDDLFIANGNLKSEISLLKEEKENLFPSNRTRKLFSLRSAHAHQILVNKNLKIEIQSLKKKNTPEPVKIH